MSVFSHHSEKVLIYDPGRSRSTVGAYIDACGKEGQFTFQVLVLAEVRTEEHQHNELFISELHDSVLQAFGGYLDFMSEARFEEGLHAINTRLPLLIENQEPTWLSHLSCIIAVVYGTSLHFAQVGPASVLFMHGNHIMDLNSHSPSITHNPLKLFKEVVSGRMEPDDRLFIGTLNFLDYFSQEKIRRIMNESDKEPITKLFDSYLLQAPATTSFGAISVLAERVAPTSIEAFVQKSREEVAPARFRSMEELIQREQTTEEILSPKLFPLVKKSVSHFSQNIRLAYKKYFLKKPIRKSPLLEDQERQLAQTRSVYVRNQKLRSKSGAQKAGKMASALATGIARTFSTATTRIRELTKKTTPIAPLVKRDVTPRRSPLEWFSTLSQPQKILCICVIVAIAAFAQGIVWSGTLRTSGKTNETIAERTEQAQQLIADIQASFLYGDDGRISDSVNSLQTLVNSFPNSSNYEKIRSQSQDVIHEAINRLQRVREISDPEKFADLAETANGDISGLAITGTTLVSSVPNSFAVIRTSLSSAESQRIASPEGIGIQQVIQSDAKTLMLLQDASVLEIGATGTATRLSTNFEKETINIAAAGTYLGRLYVADATTNQILRSGRSGNGFGTPQQWLKQASQFANASAMAIDGSIFVGFKNGTVKKFTQGSEVSFGMPELSSPLKTIDAMWTSESIDTLYVFERTNRRILVLTKEGRLLEQIVFPSLSNISGFAVQVSAKKLFVATQSAIYSTPLPDESL